MLSTLGDDVVEILHRLTMRLLQATSFVLWCSGWALERAGPLLLSASDRLNDYTKSQLEREDRPTPSARDKRSYGKEPFSTKEESPAKIANPPLPEAQPGTGTPKIQINPPSTETGIDVPKEEVTPDRPNSSEETSVDEPAQPATIGDLVAEQIVNVKTHDERHLEGEGSSPTPAPH